MDRKGVDLTGDIRIDVRSETGRLKTVVMRWACPYRLTFGMLTSVLDASVRAQLRRNTWEPYDHVRVRAQQQRVVDVLRGHGVNVLMLDDGEDSRSQHYTRDVAFCIDDALFVGRMGTRYRQPEQRAREPLLPRLSKVVRLERGRIEGGDVMLCGNKVLVGLGEATDREGVTELRQKLEQMQIAREVVPIPFAHRGVIHLDTKLNIVDGHVALFARKAFAPETVRWLETQLELIEATDEEIRGLEVNTVAIGGGKVLLQEKSERIAGLLQRRGLTPILVDYSEVTRWPGAFRCTTLPLERDDAPTA